MHNLLEKANTLCIIQNTNHKSSGEPQKIAFTAAFETLKFLHFRKLGKELGEKLGKTKPMSSPPGKHMGLYTISI